MAACLFYRVPRTSKLARISNKTYVDKLLVATSILGSKSITVKSTFRHLFCYGYNYICRWVICERYDYIYCILRNTVPITLIVQFSNYTLYK